MIAWAGQWHCEDVRIYYYDYMKHQAGTDMPASVVTHIQSCEYCQGQIAELDRMLQQIPPDQRRSDRDDAWLGMMQLHFKLADQEVHCSHVKPFFPVLLHPAFPIRISTPVMDHLEACPDCQEDLEAIKTLDLAPDQLCRLSDFLGDVQTGVIPGPHLSEEELKDFSQGRPEMLDTISLNHLCLCRECGEKVLQCWQTEQDGTSSSAPGCSLCEQAPRSEVFRAVFSYQSPGKEVDDERTADSLSSMHILECPVGRGRAIEIYRVLFSVAHRPDSGVTSRFDLERAGLLRKFASRPISALRHGVDADFSRSSKLRHLMTRGMIPLALAAMTLLFCGLIFFRSGHTAEADLSANFMKTLADTANMTITEYLPGQSKPFTTLWLAKKAELLAMQSKDLIQVYDLKAKRCTELHADGRIQQRTLSDQETQFLLDHQLVTAWGVLPAAEAIPPGIEWKKRSDPNAGASETGTYEMTINGRFGGQAHWVIEIQPKTQRPVRIEKYYRHALSQPFQRDRVSEIHYASAAEIVAAIHGLIPSR